MDTAIRARALKHIALATVATAVLTAGGAAATTLILKTLSQMCAEADMIFVGTVTGVESRWSDPETRAIETVVTFGDVDSLLGAGDGDVVLRFGGGEIGELREEIAGVPRFHPGERFVILARKGSFISPILGFNQGCLRVVDTAEGPMVESLDRSPIRLRDGDLTTAGGGAGTSLETFLDEVKSHVSDGAGGGS